MNVVQKTDLRSQGGLRINFISRTVQAWKNTRLEFCTIYPTHSSTILCAKSSAKKSYQLCHPDLSGF